MENNIIISFEQPDGIPNFIKNESEKIANIIYPVDLDKKIHDSYTQLRKYYDELLRIQAMVGSGDNFDKYLPAIYILGSKAKYAVSRDVMSEDFSNFITENIKNINKKNDFDNFILCYESILGYIKYNEYIRRIEKQKQRNMKNSNNEQSTNNYSSNSNYRNHYNKNNNKR